MEEQPNILHDSIKLPRNKSWVFPGAPPTSVDVSAFDPQVIKQLVQASIDKGYLDAEYAYGWSQIWKLQTKQATPIHVTNTCSGRRPIRSGRNRALVWSTRSTAHRISPTKTAC
jgi:hypothetical protein